MIYLKIATLVVITIISLIGSSLTFAWALKIQRQYLDVYQTLEECKYLLEYK